MSIQTDSTRLATYQLDNMNGATSIAGKFPQLLGFGKSSHSLAHGGNKAGGAEALGKWDQFKAQQFSYFLQRLKDTPEGEGNLLDHTIVVGRAFPKHRLRQMQCQQIGVFLFQHGPANFQGRR